MAKNRNDLIRDIISALGGVPSGLTRNELLQEWLDSIGGSLWTPADTTTRLWLDSADASTITESGGFVSQWRDKSGNGDHAAQGVASRQPVTGVDSINGLNTLSFVDDYLLLDSLVDFSQYKSQELFVVMQANDNGSDKAFFAQFDGGSDSFLHRYTFDNMDIDLFYAAGSISSISTPDQNLTNALIYSSYFTPAEVGVKTTQNVSYTTKSLPQAIDNSISPVSIGARNGGSNSFNGKIAEIIFVSSSLSTDDRSRFEGYLAWKWGLVTDLPLSHPYKSSPP